MSEHPTPLTQAHNPSKSNRCCSVGIGREKLHQLIHHQPMPTLEPALTSPHPTLNSADIGCEKLDQLIRDAIFQSTEREVAQADKPLAKASALLKSSLLLMTRGDGAKSEAQAKEAYQLRAKQLGEAHRDTCNALLLWASSTFVL